MRMTGPAMISSCRVMSTSARVATTASNMKMAAFVATSTVGLGLMYAADAKSEVDMSKVRAEIVKVFEADDNLGPFFVR